MRDAPPSTMCCGSPKGEARLASPTGTRHIQGSTSCLMELVQKVQMGEGSDRYLQETNLIPAKESGLHPADVGSQQRA